MDCSWQSLRSQFFFVLHSASICSDPKTTRLRRHADLSDEASGVSDDRAKSDTPHTVSWWHYLVAALVLAITTAPSWLSRLHYFGNPFYYGAIQNFLWGDTYLGSMDSPRALTVSDYFASHSLLDAAGRSRTPASALFRCLGRNLVRLAAETNSLSLALALLRIANAAARLDPAGE